LEAGHHFYFGRRIGTEFGKFARSFSNIPIVADLKTMDGGYLEAEMMAKARWLPWWVVNGRAHPNDQGGRTSREGIMG